MKIIITFDNGTQKEYNKLECEVLNFIETICELPEIKTISVRR